MSKEVSKERICFLQLENYFLQHGYLKATVLNGGKNQRNSECWMINMDEDTPFLAVRISCENKEERRQNMAFMLKMVQNLRDSMENGKKLLDITVSIDSENQDSSYAKYVQANDEIAFPEEILRVFPDLNSVFVKYEDAAAEENRLLKEINGKGFGKRKKGNVLQHLKKLSLETRIISYVCVALFALSLLVEYCFEISNTSALIVLGAYYKAMVTCCHQYWRLFTCNFLHGSFLHLACNLYSFIRINEAVLEVYGKKKTAVLFIAGALLSSSMIFATEANTVVIGLSGVIYGLLGALSVEYIAKGYLKDPIFFHGYMRLIFVNVAISLLPSTSLIGHLGGLISGVLLGIIFNEKCQKLLRINCAVCLAVVLAFVGWFALNNYHFGEYYYGTDLEVIQTYKLLGLEKTATNMNRQLLEYYETYGG